MIELIFEMLKLTDRHKFPNITLVYGSVSENRSDNAA